MSILQKRAARACAEIEEQGYGVIFVEWRKSRVYGYCPCILYHREKAAYASGCGYDKLSAVLAEYLEPLVPGIERCSGAGETSIIEFLAEHGWELKHTYSGNTEDGFTLTRKGTAHES